MVSQNMEHLGGKSTCLTSAGEAGPWLVLSDFGWLVDETIDIQCSRTRYIPPKQTNKRVTK
jgi:hypothetical protein